MLHDIIGDVEMMSVFDEHPAGFARTRVATERNVRLNIRDGSVGTVDGLLVDGLEEEFHRLQEPLMSTGGSRLDNPLVRTGIGVQEVRKLVRTLG